MSEPGFTIIDAPKERNPSGVYAGIYEAFRTLPQGKCIRVPVNGAKSGSLRTAICAGIQRRGMKCRTSVSNDKTSVLFWKPES